MIWDRFMLSYGIGLRYHMGYVYTIIWDSFMLSYGIGLRYHMG